MARPKKVKEVEETIEEALIEDEAVAEEEQDKEDWTKINAAYSEYVYEDEDDVKKICNMAIDRIYEKFRVMLGSDNRNPRNGYKMVALIFIKTFEAIINELQKLRETNATYAINIANHLVVGFTNQDNDEDEKNGNFMIYVKNLMKYVPTLDVGEYRSSDKSREYMTQWNQENMIEQPDTTKKIAAYAQKLLKEIDIKINSGEMVFPLFVSIYECIVEYMKTARSDMNLDEYEINFCNIFFIQAIEQDEGVDRIVIRPSIECKMSLKSDKIATAIYE